MPHWTPKGDGPVMGDLTRQADGAPRPANPTVTDRDLDLYDLDEATVSFYLGVLAERDRLRTELAAGRAVAQAVLDAFGLQQWRLNGRTAALAALRAWAGGGDNA